MWRTIEQIDETLIEIFHQYGHPAHRISLGVLYVWFGLLKPLGHETTTSVLAHTIYWGDPGVMVLVLGWWEVVIGICLMIWPFLRIGIFLLILRLPGILLAFLLQPEILFASFPFAPTPEGQYLIKDLTLFLATLAIAGQLREHDEPPRYKG